jgi:hypothetical protein
MSGSKSFISSLAGNWASEQPYGLYEKWFELERWDLWAFGPFKWYARNHYRKMKQRALASRCRAVIIRDRAERTIFEGEED